MIYKTYITINGAKGIIKLNNDNSMLSFLLGLNDPEEEAYLAWLAEGNTPLPADEQGVQQ